MDYLKRALQDLYARNTVNFEIFLILITASSIIINYFYSTTQTAWVFLSIKGQVIAISVVPRQKIMAVLSRANASKAVDLLVKSLEVNLV